ncbi:MAG: MmcQ/YjbR family DNA-binding protein [Mogibacterium sp.]|nr:MmcQ/YjbR family DNA-binding protein [Mogibacterium sp.]
MDIGQEVFGRKRPIRDKLPASGFLPGAGDILVYREDFLEGDLTAEIAVLPDGSVRCRAIDAYTGEEYVPIRVEAQIGAYVGAAREAYRALLERIAGACFGEVPFLGDQSNRIAAQIERFCGVEPEFPFASSPGSGAFRQPDSGKWFGILLPVTRGRIEGLEGEALVEVMNVKIDPDQLTALLAEPGICRCYHMNQKHWVSLLLDDTLSDERVMALVRESYLRTQDGRAKRSRALPHDPGSSAKQERQYWIIPSNPKYFDVDAGFARGGDVLPWHQRIQALPGDIVYIYQTEPVASIRFRCEVLQADLPRPADNSGMAPQSTRLMYLRRTDTYAAGVYPRSWMNTHGIAKTIRGQRSAPPELSEAIESR